MQAKCTVAMASPPATSPTGKSALRLTGQLDERRRDRRGEIQPFLRLIELHSDLPRVACAHPQYELLERHHGAGSPRRAMGSSSKAAARRASPAPKPKAIAGP